MALITCRFFSKVLQYQTSMQVILPESGPGIIGKKVHVPGGTYPVLWLYHGLSDNDSAWVRNTAIERYAQEYGLAVVMPDAARSYYTDMASGGRYWEFISREVMTRARQFFPLSRRRSDNYAAGLSMGGFGAFKLALQKPRSVAAAGSFSGAVDILDRLQAAGRRTAEFERMFGPFETVPGSINDLSGTMLKMTQDDKRELPALFQCCGTEDFLLQSNRTFHHAAEAVGIAHTYIEEDGFAHTWDYWEIAIRQFLEWLADQNLT